MTEQRARELLAAEYERAGFPLIAKAVRQGSGTLASEIVCRALTTALSAPFAESAKSPSDSVREALELGGADLQRLTVKFAQAADFTTEQDRRIYDSLVARAGLQSSEDQGNG